MNPAKAAPLCREFIDRPSYLANDDSPFGKKHLHYMVDEIESERVSGEKAHRWLGYLQGVLVSGQAATLDEMKNLNLQS